GPGGQPPNAEERLATSFLDMLGTVPDMSRIADCAPNVLLRDPTLRTRPLERGEVDAELLRDPANERRGAHTPFPTLQQTVANSFRGGGRGFGCFGHFDRLSVADHDEHRSDGNDLALLDPA